ncbi:MAG TPA: PAS domain-containing protein, partial [Longimicrobiales bacterium]|nr:PAS domain-containing protein [Longimicrobiales bacterium]
MTNIPFQNQEPDDAIARLRRSFDDGLAGHAIATHEGRIVACNPEFARIIGADSVEAAMQANLHELEPRPGAFRLLLARLSDSPLIPLEELELIRRDGTPARVLARVAATLDGSGRVTEVRVYLVDITKRFRDEQNIRVCAERLQLVETATQDVLWDWEVARARITWSDATARRLRYTPEEVRSGIDWHTGRIHPDDRERVLRGVQRAMFGIASTWSDEYRLLRGDGSYAAVLDRAHIVRNDRGEAVRVVGSILDMTELRAAEESHRFLARASAALETALDVQATALTLAHVVVPQLGEFCLVDLV